MAGFRLPGEGAEEILSPVDAGAAKAVNLQSMSLGKPLEDSGRGPATARTVVENEALKNPLRDELTRIKMAELAQRYPRARRTRIRNDPRGGVYAFLGGNCWQDTALATPTNPTLRHFRFRMSIHVLV